MTLNLDIYSVVARFYLLGTFWLNFSKIDPLGRAVTSPLKIVRQVGVIVRQFSFREAIYSCLTESCLNFQLNCIVLDYFGEATASFPHCSYEPAMGGGGSCSFFS